MCPVSRQFVIIGNGIAGTTCAETLRKNDPECTILLFGDEQYPLYNRVALPRYLRGEVTEEKVFMRTKAWHTEHRIDLFLNTRIVSLLTEQKTVVTDQGAEYSYDAVLIATGGRANHFQGPGHDAKGVYVFQTLDDTHQLLDRIPESRYAVTVGSSYIAYELTEALATHNIPTTWLQRGPRFLTNTLDDTGGALVDEIANHHGVTVVHGEEVQAIEKNSDGYVAGVLGKTGTHYATDLVAFGIGLTMNTNFLANSGITINKGIVTDAELRTNVPDVYAAGDVAEFFDPTFGEHLMMGTFNSAASQGRMVAYNMLGGSKIQSDLPLYTSGLFDSTIAVVGSVPHPKASGLETYSVRPAGTLTYRRVFLQDGRLKAAVMIGDKKGRLQMLDYIRKQTTIPNPELLLTIE